MGIAPVIAVVVLKDGWSESMRLTPFGKALLELLRNEGLKSGNAAIRTRSQEVIDALMQIEELEKE